MAAGWLRTTGLERVYRRGTAEVRALDGIDLEVERGEFMGLIGASGSGKSTLLNLLAGLDTPTAGSIEIGGVALETLSRRRLAALRARTVGMVFQSFNLIGHLSALRNVELALVFGGVPARERTPRARRILERLGLGERLHHRPADLSGGEQQRVALARALVGEPELLLADEPTGNLDHDNTQSIAALLAELHAQGLTIILATHDLELAESAAGRTVRLHYGRVAADTAAGSDETPPRPTDGGDR
jgi:ABC-type lipoprotein export system ATPase subunit